MVFIVVLIIPSVSIPSKERGLMLQALRFRIIVEDFGDWYLPSKDEMAKMYLQVAVIPAITGGANYWSSTEESVSNPESTSLNAYQVIISTGAASLQLKSGTARVRAIRRF